MTGWTVGIDRTACIGCGVCLAYAPGSLAHDESGQAVLIDPPADSLDQVRRAVDSCPTGALELILHDPALRGGEG